MSWVLFRTVIVPNEARNRDYDEYVRIWNDDGETFWTKNIGEAWSFTTRNDAEKRQSWLAKHGENGVGIQTNILTISEEELQKSRNKVQADEVAVYTENDMQVVKDRYRVLHKNLLQAEKECFAWTLEAQARRDNWIQVCKERDAEIAKVLVLQQERDALKVQLEKIKKDAKLVGCVEGKTSNAAKFDDLYRRMDIQLEVLHGDFRSHTPLSGAIVYGILSNLKEALWEVAKKASGL